MRCIVSLLNPGMPGRPKQLFSTDNALIERFVRAEERAARNIYETINPLKDDATERRLENVRELARFALDIDFKDIAEPPEEVDERLRQLLLAPSVIRNSGHGRHVLFELKEPIPPDTPEFEQALALWKTLARQLSADPAVTVPHGLLRIEGSLNVKHDPPVRCERIGGTGKPVDITEIEALADLLPEDGLFTRRKINGSGSHATAEDNEEPRRSEPIDVDTRLAAMRWKGPGNTSVHRTQLQCVGALLRRGIALDETVRTVLDATRQAVANHPKAEKWNWEREEHHIFGMGADLVNKAPELAILLPDPLLAAWNDRIANGRTPKITYAPHIGWHVRSRRGAEPAAGADTAEPKPEHTARGTTGANSPPRKHRFTLVAFSDLRPGPEQLYLVDELIPVAGLVDVWGKAKCFKSFWTLDVMLHVACGWEYRDRYVRQGAVVYCAFEGAHGYKKRIEALRRHYDIAPDANVPLYVMPGQANLIKEHPKLIGDITEQLRNITPTAVVLDTLNKSLHGSENKDVDMGDYIRAAEAIRDAFSCVVIIVHHCGYDDTRPRGHSSLPGAVDCQISITRDGDAVTATVEMMRDGPEDTAVNSVAERIDVGQDQTGKVLTSLVLVPSTGDEHVAGRRAWPKSLRTFHKALTTVLKAKGVAFHPAAGVLPVRAADLEDVREEFYQTYAATSATERNRQEAREKAFKRVVRSTSEQGLTETRVSHGKTMIWIPDRVAE